MIPSVSERGLVVAPRGRDAEVAATLLREADFSSDVCGSLDELVEGLTQGAGFALVTEESLLEADLRALVAWLSSQPEWSDFPFILLTSRGGIERNPAASRHLETLGNVTFLERPFHPTTLISLIQSALRGRRRQYEARSRLETLHKTSDRLAAALHTSKLTENELRVLNETLEARVTAAIEESRVFGSIVESTDALVEVLDNDFRWIAINNAAAQDFRNAFGVLPDIGDRLTELLAPHPDTLASDKQLWERALGGEEFTHLSTPGEGRSRFLEMKFNVLRDSAGRQIGAYRFAHDVTDRLRNEERLKEAEEGLRQAQKMEAVGQLTGGVAHDFNNLLMVLSGGLRMLGNGKHPERRQLIMDSMNQAVARGASLTRQLLAFSRRKPLEKKTIDVRRQLEGMREILERSLRADVDVQMNFADKLWPVELDTGEFELAILNLCVNARDAIPGEGTISISAENVVRQQDLAGGKYVVVTVEDDGSGMPPEVIARAFEPFFTTKEVGKGSGLGLAQVYAFTTQSGGYVNIESSPGRGTRISLSFPRSHAEVVTEEITQPDAAAIRPFEQRNRSHHVLLVEDDKEVAAMTTEMLDSLGCQVTHVSSALSALGALANGRPMDAVFSDVMMAGGMNGLELAREIRRRRPTLPIILATGYFEAARGAEADGFQILLKPYEIDKLASVLRDELAHTQ